MKDPFAPYIHLFLLFESLSFLLIQGSARILAGGFDTTKRGYVLSATRIFPRVRSRHPANFIDCVSSITLKKIFFLIHQFFLISLFISSLRAE